MLHGFFVTVFSVLIVFELLLNNFCADFNSADMRDTNRVNVLSSYLCIGKLKFISSPTFFQLNLILLDVSPDNLSSKLKGMIP